jgi:type VI secretion system protein ImpG
MRDELLSYYERELAYLRQMGADFAGKYPKIASRLALDVDKCEDPHVERLIESFAYLSARIRLKIDDEFPEITESFLNVLYPHYLAPIPSMSIVQFALDADQGKLTTGYVVERGTILYSRPIQGTPCRFRTSYPVTLWPLEVVAASLDSPDPVGARGRWERAALRLDIRCLNETKLAELKLMEAGRQPRPLDSLRFYLNGEPQLIHALYEYIFNNAARVEIRPAAAARKGSARAAAASPAAVALAADALRPVGFEADEAMLPYTARSFAGYRLLTEYFAFPEKFLFFDVTGIGQAALAAGVGSEFSIVIQLRDVAPLGGIGAETFRLGCAPVVNLFKKIAEPVQLTSEQHEYRVVADVHRQQATEVYSIDGVTSTDPTLKRAHEYQPFYSVRHAATRDEEGQSYWYASRRRSQAKDDEGTEVYISLVDLGFNPHVPAAETLTVVTTASNRDLPSKLPFGGREGDFEVEGAGTLARVRCLRKPTQTLRPPMRRAAHWRLISHLSLNHLSISGADGAAALREILTLYDFMDSQATRKQIAGIVGVEGRRVVRRTGSRVGAGFVSGAETKVELNEEQFVGASIFLFASVLERFLGLYVTVNSFNQLVVSVSQREGTLKRWEPRAGEQALL